MGPLRLLYSYRHIMLVISLAFIFQVAFAAHPAPAYGYGPSYTCRDTNTSVYAEVCVPAFTEKVTPVTLAVKEVVDNDYCFDRVLTVCEETSTTVEREICTYVYEKEEVVAPCTTTQVTYDQKSETMKVTACGAAGYGYGHHGYGQGEHQVCREEYQTQAYKVPLVTAPLEQSCMLAYPAPKQVCVTKAIEITELSARTRLRTSASMLPSLLMLPTLLTRRRSSLVNQAVNRSPSLFLHNHAARHMLLLFIMPQSIMVKKC